MLLGKHLAARSIQNSWRVSKSHSILFSLQFEFLSAQKIQSAWRGFFCHSDYLFDLYSIIKVQSLVRRQSAMRRARLRKILRKFNSATIIQAHWRCFAQRCNYISDIADITAVQACARRRRAAKQYTHLLNEWSQLQNRSATSIQSYWRRNYARSILHQHFATRRIQTLWRRSKACKTRQLLEAEYVAALKVQSAWRGYVAFENYMLELVYIIQIQSIARQNAARKELQERQHKKQVASAATIQSLWRGHACFIQYIMDVADIVTVQSTVRRQLASEKAQKLRRARQNKCAVLIQKTWRRCSAATAYKQTLSRYNSAVAVQAAWRSHFCKTSYDLLCSDIITAQSQVRKYFAQKEFQKRIHTHHECKASIVQAAWRAHHWRRIYMMTLADIIMVQSQIRALSARKEISRRLVVRNIASSNIIQTAWRAYFVRTNYQFAMDNITKVQSMARQYLAKKQVATLQAEKCKTAATKIESAWRAYFVRTSYIVALNDIIQVQAFVRRAIVQQEFKKWLAKRRALAATKIQSVLRASFVRTSYIIALDGIIKVQAFARKITGQQQFKKLVEEHNALAATKIQSAWRVYFVRTSYYLLLSDIIIAQCQVRKYFAQKEYQKRIHNHHECKAIILQTAWRVHQQSTTYLMTLADIIMVQAQTRVNFARKELSRRLVVRDITYSTLIQKTWRAYHVRTNYQFAMKNITKVQSMARQYLAKMEVAILQAEKCKTAATKIESAWRAYFVRTSYIMALDDIIKVQAFSRRAIVQNKFRNLVKEHNALAATKIQSTWRAYFVRTSFIIALDDIIQVQAFARRIIVQNRFRKLVEECRALAATKIQSTWRGHVLYTTYAILYFDIVRVQSLARAVLAQRLYNQKKAERKECAIVKIQQIVRGKAARGILHTLLLNKSATSVQSTWRGFYKRQHYLFQIGSIIEIQSVVRMIAASRDFRQKRIAVTKIQTIHRRFQGRIQTLSLISTVILAKMCEHSYGCATTTIQCAWRLYKLEKKLAAEKMRLTALKNEAAITLQLWYPVASRVRVKRQARAAKVIYKFLKMVKIEVDKAIAAEEKKYKFREKMRNRTKKLDEELLEGAWEKMEVKVVASKCNRKDRSKKHKLGERQTNLPNMVASRASTRRRTGQQSATCSNTVTSCSSNHRNKHSYYQQQQQQQQQSAPSDIAPRTSRVSSSARREEEHHAVGSQASSYLRGGPGAPLLPPREVVMTMDSAEEKQILTEKMTEDSADNFRNRAPGPVDSLLSEAFYEDRLPPSVARSTASCGRVAALSPSIPVPPATKQTTAAVDGTELLEGVWETIDADIVATAAAAAASTPKATKAILSVCGSPYQQQHHHHHHHHHHHQQQQQQQHRLPRPRIASLSDCHFTQDLSLEEAYLDMEISGAKERRMAVKVQKREERRCAKRSDNCSRGAYSTNSGQRRRNNQNMATTTTSATAATTTRTGGATSSSSRSCNASYDAAVRSAANRRVVEQCTMNNVIPTTSRQNPTSSAADVGRSRSHSMNQRPLLPPLQIRVIDPEEEA